MHWQLLPTHGQQREFRNELFGELVRAIDVVATGDDDGKLVARLVRLAHHLCSSLGGCAWTAISRLTVSSTNRRELVKILKPLAYRPGSVIQTTAEADGV